jgi:predicted amidohydrolase YtcJ
MVIRWSSIAALILLFPSASSAEDAATLLLRDGVFYPVSVPGPVEGSLAVRDGRIAHLGPTAQVKALVGAATRIIDLGGRSVTPGFIDAHSHLELLGRSLQQVDLVGTVSYEQVVERIRALAEGIPEGEWILGRGWDQNDWEEEEFPHHAPLSRAVPEHPVWMKRIDGHAALVNAAAMTRLGLSAENEDPPGGRLLRDSDGRLTGILIDEAMRRPEKQISERSAEQLERWVLAGADHCLGRGLTTVTDMGVTSRVHAAYERLREKGVLPLRVALFLTDEEELLEEWFSRGPEVDPEARLLVRGVKMYADGALGSRGAALLEPYDDDRGNMGLLRASSDHIAQVCARALAAGFQVGIHAIGDRGALLSLDAIERCFQGPRPEARFRLEHAQVMRLQDIDRMAKLGVIASMQPTHATSDMPWAEQRVGPQRIRGAYAWQRVLRAGGHLALGSDFPVEKADPLLGFFAAVARQDEHGDPPGGWRPEERLSREEALRGFTLEAAHSLFLEEEIGSLEVGKLADLVVFSRDIMMIPVDEIPRTQVDYTVVGGEVVFARGQLE